MDKRMIKSKQAIMMAFIDLLETKSFEQVTVKEIIERAHISRSTFYAHFETKEDLLASLCDQLVDHVFSKSQTGLEELEHLFRHFLNNLDRITSLLMSDSPYFNRWLRQQLEDPLYHLALQQGYKSDPMLPLSYQKVQLTQIFIESVKWSLAQSTPVNEQELADYYVRFIGN